MRGRWRGWVVVALCGCGGLPAGALGLWPADDEVVCEKGTSSVDVGAELADPARWVEGTELRLCRDRDGRNQGRQLERYPGGGVAAEGAWRDGVRHGAWTRWSPTGGFVQRMDHVAGIPQGVRREVSGDGAILELLIDDGRAIGLKALPRDRPMPEWRDGGRVEGLRHLDGAGDAADPVDAESTL